MQPVVGRQSSELLMEVLICRGNALALLRAYSGSLVEQVLVPASIRLYREKPARPERYHCLIGSSGKLKFGGRVGDAHPSEHRVGCRKVGPVHQIPSFGWINWEVQFVVNGWGNRRPHERTAGRTRLCGSCHATIHDFW
jgi:hypothetical protein